MNISCKGATIATRLFDFPLQEKQESVHIPKHFARVDLTLDITACTASLILAPKFLDGLHYSYRRQKSLQIVIADMDNVEVQSGAFDLDIDPSKYLLVEATFSKIRNLTINTNSFHDTGLQTISFTQSVISPISNQSFSKLRLSSFLMHSCNISVIPTQAMGLDVQVRDFQFSHNFVDTLQANAIVLKAAVLATISSNSFQTVEENAFQELNATKLEFKANSFSSFAPRMLAFGISEDRIDFKSNRMTEACNCYDSYQNLLHPNSEFLPELVCFSSEHQTYISVGEYVKTFCETKIIRSRGTAEHLSWCQWLNQSIICNCNDNSEENDPTMDKNSVLNIEFQNCPTIELHLKEIMDFPLLEVLNVSDTDSLKIVPLQSPKEPREKGGVKFIFNNVTIRDAIKPDTFCGPNFKELVFKDSEINFIDRKAFHELTQLDLIEFQGCEIIEDVSKQAFLNVTVKEFRILSSNVGTLDTESFGLNLERAFSVVDTNIGDIQTHALKSVRLLNEETEFILKNISVTGSYEEGSLAVTNPDRIEVDHLIITMDCDCYMHDIELIQFDQPRMHHDLSNLVSNLWCLGQSGEWIKWKIFDKGHCDEEEGHDHTFLTYDESGLHLTKWAVLAIVLVLILIIAIVIGVILKFKNNPILAPHLPIVDEDDDANWKRVSFEAMRYRSKSSGQQDLRTRRRESLQGMLQPPGYHTHPSPTLFHRVSIKSLKHDDGLMHETETFELQPQFDRTLDIIQDTHPDRISARQSMPPTST